MDLDLDVMREADVALQKAQALNPAAEGRLGLGLYSPLAAALQRLSDWTAVRPPPLLFASPQLSLRSVQTSMETLRRV